MVKSPRRVFLGGAEGYMIGMAPIAVGGVFAEGGHLDHARRPGSFHGNYAKGRANGQRAATPKDLADLLRRGIGGHVKILGRPSQ